MNVTEAKKKLDELFTDYDIWLERGAREEDRAIDYRMNVEDGARVATRIVEGRPCL
jgi:hypothetical protein